MKKLIPLILLTTFIHQSTYSQDISVPLKDGKIFYEQVDSASGVSKDQIYTRVKLWMANAFASAKNVIQMDDKEAGVLVGKGNFSIHSTGLAAATWPCYFTLSVTAKEGKYRVQVYNFTYGEANYKMESVYEAYNKGKMKKSTGNMLKEMDHTVAMIFKNIKEQISTNQSDF